MNQYDVSGILGNTGERENVKKEEIYIYITCIVPLGNVFCTGRTRTERKRTKRSQMDRGFFEGDKK